MSAIRFVVDRRALASAQVRRAAAGALTDAAEFLLEESNRTVPIEEHTLEASGMVTPATPDKLISVVSYGTPYAVVQHEHTEFHHDPGRRAKWLEQTFKEQSSRVADFIGNKIRGAL